MNVVTETTFSSSQGSNTVHHALGTVLALKTLQIHHLLAREGCLHHVDQTFLDDWQLLSTLFNCDHVQNTPFLDYSHGFACAHHSFDNKLGSSSS